jgi:hypothetical protein
VNFNEKKFKFASQCVLVEIPLFDFVLTGFSPLFSRRDLVLYEQGDSQIHFPPVVLWSFSL